MLYQTAPLTTFLVLIVGTASSLQEGYYWRDYTGIVPEDAIVGGKNVNGENVYIGQAYVRSRGLIVVQINPGATTVYAPVKRILHQVTNHIKILCGSQENFHWVPTSADELQSTLLYNHVVVGGHEDRFGPLNIGRISHQNGVKIGKVTPFQFEDACFQLNDKSRRATCIRPFYEVLVYDNSAGRTTTTEAATTNDVTTKDVEGTSVADVTTDVADDTNITTIK